MRKTPAATMVAAWMRALTGVGPSIASGSQTWRGTWPDFPAAPQKMRMPMAEATVRPRTVVCAGSVARAAAFEAAGAGVVEEQGAGLGVEPDHADEEAEVADAGGDEGFFRGGGGFGLGVPEADEEVGGEADDLPAHEEQQQAVGDDDAEHGSGEEGEEAEEAGEVLVVLHVAGAVDEDEQADEGDHDQHDGGEGIEHPAELEPLVAELEPVEVEGLDGCAVDGRAHAAKAQRESRSEMAMEPMARAAAGMRLRCFRRAAIPAARMGSAGMSQRL